MWRAATDAGADAVSINSFNDWNGGDQIESAKVGPKPQRPPEGRRGVAPPNYASYEPNPPDFYVRETARHAANYLRERGQPKARDEL